MVCQSAPPASSPAPRLRARSMLSLGTEFFLAFWMASHSVGLPAGSPPPVRAATSMFLISFANILPRRASMTAFLCLVVAHLEWPLIDVPFSVRRSRRWYRRHAPRAAGLSRRRGTAWQQGGFTGIPRQYGHLAATWEGGREGAREGEFRRSRPLEWSSRDHARMRIRSGQPRLYVLFAAARDGVIHARALVALGVPETTVYRRCRDGGPWQ